MAGFLGVSDVIWSGAIGSALTLLGVGVSNWSNTSRLKRQIKHDAQEKVRQRKADIRKSIYLEVAEEYVKANAHLGGMSELKLGINGALGLQNFNGAAAKALLICDASSLKLISDLQLKHSIFSMRCVAKAQPARNLQSEVEIHQNAYDGAQVEIKRILSAMVTLNENANGDQAAMARLNRSMEIQQAMAAQSNENKIAVLSRIVTAHVDYLRFTVAGLTEVNDQSTTALIAMRRELEIDENSKAVERILLERNQLLKNSLTEVLGEVIPGFSGPGKPVFNDLKEASQ
jgi:hypothetical protein